MTTFGRQHLRSDLTFKVYTNGLNGCNNCGISNYDPNDLDFEPVTTIERETRFQRVIYSVEVGYGNMRTRIDLCAACRSKLAEEAAAF